MVKVRINMQNPMSTAGLLLRVFKFTETKLSAENIIRDINTAMEVLMIPNFVWFNSFDSTHVKGT